MGRRARAIALLGSLTATLLLAAAALCEEAADGKLDLEALREERTKVARRNEVRQLTAKRFTTVVELLEKSQYAEARAKLEKLNFGRLNVYERALGYRLLAYAAFGVEDFEAAVDYFEKAVEQEALQIDEEASVRFNVAQLYAALERWQKVIDTLQLWFRYVEEPNPLAYYLLAIAHYQLEEFDLALDPAIQAVALAPEPREGWLQLLSALYLQKEDYDSAVPVLERLVTKFPKKPYWVQLSLIYGARGDYKESLAVQQLAYTLGLLTDDSDLRRLARSYLYHQIPYPAARVLEKGLEEGRIEPDQEVLELLGNSWIAAREFGEAVEPLARAAALSSDGRLYLRLAQVHVQREEWEQASELVQKALEKGGLEDPGRAQLLLGISLYSEGRVEQARSVFVRARAHDSSRTEANAWLEHIAHENQAG